MGGLQWIICVRVERHTHKSVDPFLFLARNTTGFPQSVVNMYDSGLIEKPPSYAFISCCKGRGYFMDLIGSGKYMHYVRGRRAKIYTDSEWYLDLWLHSIWGASGSSICIQRRRSDFNFFERGVLFRLAEVLSWIVLKLLNHCKNATSYFLFGVRAFGTGVLYAVFSIPRSRTYKQVHGSGMILLLSWILPRSST